MVIFRYESELLAPVATFLKRQGYRCQLPELPFYEYRIDVAGYDPGQDRIVAVELKLKRWRRALQQAYVYQLCADLAYVAMPLRATSRVDRDELAKTGVGLIGVEDGGGCVTVVGAVHSTVVAQNYREHVKRLTEDGSASRF
jgi:hypothetical protein